MTAYVADDKSTLWSSPSFSRTVLYFKVDRLEILFLCRNKLG